MHKFINKACVLYFLLHFVQLQIVEAQDTVLLHRLQELNSIILSQPNFDAYNERGDIMYSFGDFTGAIRDYSEAITFKANDNKIFMKRGKAKDAIGEVTGALIDLNISLSLDSTIMEAWYYRGIAKRALGDYSGAIEDYTQAILRAPEYAPAYNSRGLALMYADDDKALDDFNKAIDLNPEFADAYNNRADYFYMYNKEKEACADWAKSSELGNFKAKKSLSRFCEAASETAK